MKKNMARSGMVLVPEKIRENHEIQWFIVMFLLKLWGPSKRRPILTHPIHPDMPIRC
jgi:hypothetical protein